MRRMPGNRHRPGLRRLPRPGSAGGSRGGLSVPGLRGRRSRCGSGPVGTPAREGSDRGLGSAVPSRMTGRTLQAPPEGATCGVQPHCITGAPSRGASKAAASSRQALLSRRASVVTSAQRTAMRSERASDDADTRDRQPAEGVDTQRRERVSGRAPARGWSGARWCQGSTAGFPSGNPLRSGCSLPTGRGRDRGAAFRAGGTLYFGAL